MTPLEASALMLIETAVDVIADRLPRTRAAMDTIGRQFNAAFRHHWDRIIEFLKLHYVLTKRTDSAFWRDNVAAESIPDSLRERLLLWRDHPPAPQDFTHAPEVFSWPSYQYILHGMGFETRYSALARVNREAAAAQRWLRKVEAVREEALRKLPVHRELVGKIREYGLQVI